MQRAPELIALGQGDDAEIADHSLRRSQFIGGGLLVAAGLVAAYFVLAGHDKATKDTLNSEEEFSTTGFRPPSFMREEGKQSEQPEPKVLELPPPPPAPAEEDVDTTQFNVPPPPEPAEGPKAPEAAAGAEDGFPERYRSKMVIYDQRSVPKTEGNRDDGNCTAVAGLDRSSKFLAAAIGLRDRSAKARKIERIDAMVPEGTLIAGILETAIVSDLPGQIRAIVSRDVYSFDGRRVLIPTGTRLIGEYQSEATQGQTRIFVVWTRMLRDDGVSIRLDSIGADSLGRSGLTGHVDKKFRERFGAAILLSIIGGGASYLTGYGSDRAGGGNENSGRAEETARETIAQTFSDMANQALGDSLKIPPTISVAQGERIFVFVRQDLDFSAMYDDPVTEALKEVRRERGLK
ncbi:type IV secretion system protein VirB10 [Mesorhizobium sp. VK4C]|uniref:type IV secretion system protein VirB10 n=1 Tax=Mesorhizobium captivum TaxID=3072319 RepID=UPI002A24A348|nr:type IV secretion system protein VirB10 [Mesorhizobium sp. VK4C]MDX8500697.1 type IV secretion system protein VirB10 [Mesorhizobium sp. VK4C]